MEINILIKRKNTFIAIIVILVCLLIFLAYYFGTKQGELPGPGPGITFPKDLGAGEVGEVVVKNEETGEELPLISPTIPPAIFSTAGIINEVKSDRVIVRGEGTNFADRIPRTLSAAFTTETVMFNQNQTLRWVGKAGLQKLEKGMRVLITSSENIRGKTEFYVKTINIL